MSKRQQQQRKKNREAQKRQQEELQAHRSAAQTSAQHAENLVDEMQSPEFLDKFRDAELPGWLEEELGPEASPVWSIANESQSDYRRHRFLNENRAERVIAEHNPGRLCKGPILELAQRVHNRPDKSARIDLTDQEVRWIREAERAKTAQQSLGKDARGLRAVTEAINTTRVEHGDDGDSDGGSVRGSLRKVFK